MRNRWPDPGGRRRAVGAALAGPLDPLAEHADGAIERWLADAAAPPAALLHFSLVSSDPDDLTLRQARALAQADRVFHHRNVPEAILDRARADAVRILCHAIPDASAGLSVYLEMAA